ncbi:hypothetical protein [Cronobacter dublinensis]|uniref:hypothetical protein n=1 Tax=Cronobacter dublinensis TaxID=413497 RepID=UPI00300E4068
MKKKKKINFNILLVSIPICLALVIPIILYVTHMGGSLSHKNEDWGDFGSFIGGIYGSLFSSLSLLVVIAASIQTYKSNREQVNILKKDQHFNQFNTILKNLRNVYPQTYKSSYRTLAIGEHYHDFLSYISLSADADYNDIEGIKKELRRHASAYYQSSRNNVFEREAKLFSYILRLIEQSTNDMSEAFKIIFENTFNNNERLCLESYIRAYYPDLAHILNEWPSLSVIPDQCVVDARINISINKKTGV